MPGVSISKFDRTKIDLKFLCISCDLLLNEPMQTQCGHLMCKSCLQVVLKNSNPVCPKDGTTLMKDYVFFDAFTNREIMELRLMCPNNNCDWSGSNKELQEHFNCCDHALILCVHDQCQKEIKRSLLAQHLKNDCNYRLVRCTYCEQEMAISLLKEHMEMSCPAIPLKCKHCGTTGIKRSELTKHEMLECEEMEVECEFKVIGCSQSKVVKRKELRYHMNDRQTYHMQLLVRSVVGILGQLQGLTLTTHNSTSLGSAVEELKTLSGVHSVGVKNLTEKYASMISVVKALETKIGSLGSSKESGKGSGNELSDLKKRLEGVEEKNRKLGDEVREKTTMIEVLKTRLDHIGDSIALNTARLSEIAINTDSVVSYSGTLLWKIDNFNLKRQEAINGIQAAFYSPHFYSSEFGYKMCVRIYLNGDGFGKGTHISLFFVVMKGEYDALLPWPFQKKITMMILDQVNGDHMIDAFRSDPDSSSFQRPKNRLNIASGSPLFLPLETLQTRAYVKDDSMFVKIIIG